VQAGTQQRLVEIHEGFLAPDDVIQADRKDTAGNDLRSGRFRVRAVEGIARVVGAK